MSGAESFESCPAKHKNAVVYKVNMRILNVYRINLNRRCKKMEKIRIGIVGYGNIGRGVEQSIKRNDDMELKAVFTRRDPVSVSIQTEGAVVKHFDDMESMKDEIDVMPPCGVPI